MFLKLLHFPQEGEFLREIWLAALEGGLWGLAVGAGAAVVLLSARPAWQGAALFAALCGLALWAGETAGRVYHRPGNASGWAALDGLVPLAGALMFLALLGAALAGRRQAAGGWESKTGPAQ